MHVEGATANVVDRLGVDRQCARGRTGEHKDLWLDDSGGDLWRRVDSDAKLGFRSVVHGETLEETRSAKSIAELRSVSCTNSNLNS